MLQPTTNQVVSSSAVRTLTSHSLTHSLWGGPTNHLNHHHHHSLSLPLYSSSTLIHLYSPSHITQSIFNNLSLPSSSPLISQYVATYYSSSSGYATDIIPIGPCSAPRRRQPLSTLPPRPTPSHQHPPPLADAFATHSVCINTFCHLLPISISLRRRIITPNTLVLTKVSRDSERESSRDVLVLSCLLVCRNGT
jgi:hypothetical protein